MKGSVDDRAEPGGALGVCKQMEAQILAPSSHVHNQTGKG